MWRQRAGGKLFNSPGGGHAKKRVAVRSGDFLHHSPREGLRVCGYPQYLAGVNFVGVCQHGFVGFKNLWIFVGRTVKLFADF